MKRYIIKSGDKVYEYNGESYIIDNEGLNIIINNDEGFNEYGATFK